MRIVREWAGREREFALNFGGVMDLEQACGDGKTPVAVGLLFQRLTRGLFAAADIRHTIRLALIGGGMGLAEANKLLHDQFDASPYLRHATLAVDILSAVMVGIEPEAASEPDPEPAPFKFSEVVQICQTFHMSPQDLRALPFADFVNLIRGFNAASSRKAEFLSEEEFNEILAKYEPEALNG
ncbi:hypothetical protein GCM10010873_26590 [Cypionkella aquatica]|uniref:Uncharacterized protein n=1 Tax=Cypionkella aquatica TaxID=1756042 RepID=A0AA37U6E4_9RHOB|nr:gene transfer agent family protein [Cypionkella aquatica]GLS87685.1 hypothetical protein GCM10010873_26590 [Cypionkella aquatica]